MLEYVVAGHTKLVLSNGCTKAARVTAAYLEKQGICVGNAFLELGAGTGLVGMVAAICGASAVMLTDQEPMMDMLKENCEFNLKDALEPRICLSSLFWGDGLSPTVADFSKKVDYVLAIDLVQFLNGDASVVCCSVCGTFR
jgi:predicted nicotinamide N-methyase